MSLIKFALSPKLCSRKVILSSHPCIPQPSHFHSLRIHGDPLTPSHNSIPSYCPPRFSHKLWILRRNEDSRVKLLATTDSSSSGEQEDPRALEAVLKLYEAIKNKNLRELSDVLGDECRCACNFIPFFRAFQGKEQVLAFFSYLIEAFGNDIEFVVKPTIHDGMSVGVSWKLEWNKKTVPFGKGFSFHIVQTYQGRVTVSNVEMFMEPLLHMEPFRLKMLGFLRSMTEKMSSCISSVRESKRAGFFFLLCLAAILVLLLKIKFQ